MVFGVTPRLVNMGIVMVTTTFIHLWGDVTDILFEGLIPLNGPLCANVGPYIGGGLGGLYSIAGGVINAPPRGGAETFVNGTISGVQLSFGGAIVICGIIMVNVGIDSKLGTRCREMWGTINKLFIYVFGRLFEGSTLLYHLYGGLLVVGKGVGYLYRPFSCFATI